MARHMVTQYGMSEQLGLATFEEPRQAFLNVQAGVVPGAREYSERTAQTIDEEIRRILAEAHGRVRETLAKRRGVLETLAKLLLEKEVVNRQTLDEVLKAHPA
jgi:cell division protease FtsH